MALNLEAHDHQQLAAIDALVAPLERVGLVTKKDAETARAAAKRAHHALTLAATYTDHVTRTATSAGEALADRDDLTIDAVVASAILSNPIVVDATLAATWQANVDTARAAAFKRVRDFPTKLSELFDHVSDQVIDIASQLGDVDTPQAALDAGLSDPWQQLMALKADMNALIELRTELRSFGLIPESQPFNSGWQWDLRHEYPAGRFKRAYDQAAVDQGRELLILTARCRPYVPADATEAKTVLEAHTTAIREAEAA